MIDVFADIWCPFAYVGLTVVRQYRNDHAAARPIRVRAWPLELVNGKPEDVDTTTKHVAELREQVGPHLFTGFDPAAFPTSSLSALAIAAAAERAGQGEAAAFRLRRALWEEGRDIGDVGVLDALADELGVQVTDTDRAAVVDDWQDGRKRGVQGSPHYFCGAADLFTADLGRLRSFLEGCCA